MKDTKNALDAFRAAPFRPGDGWPSGGFQAGHPAAFPVGTARAVLRAHAIGAGSREILFYEASEGGAGVLRQLAEDPTVLPALARRALELCHYDPDTSKIAAP